MMVLKRLGRDSIIYGGSDFLVKLVAFALFPLLAITLSPSGFGTLELIMTMVGLAGLITGCGLNNAIHRFYWENELDETKRSQLISTGFFLQLFFWIILASILFAFHFLGTVFFNKLGSLFHFKLTTTAVFAILILIYVRLSSRYIQDVIRLYFRPVKFFIFAFLAQGVTVIIATLVIVFFSETITAFLITLSSIGFLFLPIGIYLIKKDVTFNFNKKIARKIINYGYPFIFAGIAYWLFGSMDRWMLSFLSSVSETGIYSVAFRFVSVIFMVSAAFGQAWSPYAFKIKRDYPEKHQKIYANIFLILIFVMLALGGGLALFAGEIIGLIMPVEYHSAALPLVILSFAIIIQSTQQITAIGISFMKKTKIIATIAWISAGVNFLGNYLLIPYFGSVGAAVSTLISYLFITMGYVIFTQKLYPLPIAWNKIGFLFVVAIIVAFVSISFNSTNFNFYLCLSKFLFALIFLVLGFFILNIKKIYIETNA